jgi:hypothetical protein
LLLTPSFTSDGKGQQDDLGRANKETSFLEGDMRSFFLFAQPPGKEVMSWEMIIRNGKGCIDQQLVLFQHFHALSKTSIETRREE